MGLWGRGAAGRPRRAALSPAQIADIRLAPDELDRFDGDGGRVDVVVVPRCWRTVEAEAGTWYGMADGAGRLRCRSVTVAVWGRGAVGPWGRGAAGRPRRAALSPAQIADIRLAPDELDRFEFVVPDELESVLVPRLARRLTSCPATSSGVYLEDGTAARV